MSDQPISVQWSHPICRPLHTERKGPFLRLDDATIAHIDDKGFWTSRDHGESWAGPTPVCQGLNYGEPASYRALRTRSGTIVLVYLNFTDWRFDWDEERKEPGPGCKLEMWSIRSADGGRTWTDNQPILTGYNANFFGFIETRSGRLVVVAEHLVPNPGRWVSCSLVSDDEGATWKRSNLIDLGGHGHHDGATEPTVAELSDGRLLMLIRTNLDRFWQAISDDGGRYWRVIQPSQIAASTSPGMLLRPASGRLILAYNQLGPKEGEVKKSPPGQASEVPASWYREELSITISDDDGRTWSDPLVLARQPGGQISYPYLWEPEPGEIWLIAGFAFAKRWEEPLSFRVKIRETELLDAAGMA